MNNWSRSLTMAASSMLVVMAIVSIFASFPNGLRISFIVLAAAASFFAGYDHGSESQPQTPQDMPQIPSQILTLLQRHIETHDVHPYDPGTVAIQIRNLQGSVAYMVQLLQQMAITRPIVAPPAAEDFPSAAMESDQPDDESNS